MSEKTERPDVSLASIRAAIALPNHRPSLSVTSLYVRNDHPGALASTIAWLSILMGALSGLVLGLWSFGGPISSPDWIGSYDALPRRFLRLGHVAFFALGILHLLVARQIASTPSTELIDCSARWAMAFGNIVMPLSLLAAAYWEPFKYLTPAPALALSFAFGVAATGACRHCLGGLR